MNYCQKDYRLQKNSWDIPGHYLHVGIGIFLLSFIFYIYTLSPTIIWSDSAAFTIQAKEPRMGYSITNHYLFIILGKLFSFLPFEPAYSMNLLSAVTASITVFIVYFIILDITQSKFASLTGSLALTVSHAFWLHAVIAEVYDLNACFVAAVILTLLKWRRNKDNYMPLYLAAFLFGLGLTNHRIILFDIVGIIVFIFLTEPKIIRKAKVIFSMIMSFIIGALFLIYPIINKILVKPVADVVDTFTAEGYKASVIKYSPKILEEIGLYLSYLFYQFPLIGFLLGFAGLVAIFRNDRKLSLLFLLLIGVNAVFFMKFGPAFGTTKYTFYISGYMVFSILIGCGAVFFQNVLIKRESSAVKFSIVIMLMIFLFPMALYSITPVLSKAFDIDLLHARTLPYRDNQEYFLNPNKRGYTGAARYAQEALETAKPNSIIIADHTPFTVLRYFQEIKGLRKDLTLIMPNSKKRTEDGKLIRLRTKDIVARYYGKREIYLADMEERGYYFLKPLKNNYDFIPDGLLYRVVKKKTVNP